MEVIQGELVAVSDALIGEPGGLQPAGGEQPTNEPAETALLHLPPLVRADSLSVRFD
ncbi:hypothetical protein GCM10027436_54990 [Actinophytocola sediminis]